MVRVLAALALAGIMTGCLLSAPSPAPAPAEASGQEPSISQEPLSSAPGEAASLRPDPSPSHASSPAPSASLAPIAFRQPRSRSLPAGYELPPFQTLEPLREFYRLEWLPDGYPARRMDDGSLVPHPIYGVYVLRDYVRQYRRSPSPALGRALRIVARAALARMEPFRGSLVFRYPRALETRRPLTDRYSGLTQAYYAVTLYEVYEAIGDELYRDAAELCFRSLLVREEDGGVLYRWDDEVAIAEVPARPRDLVLNGWQSALISVHHYARLSGSVAARRLFEESSATMARLLPLFDARDYRNSRYALTGPIDARVTISPDTSGVSLTDVSIHIPKDGTFDVTPGALSKWQMHLDARDVTTADGVFRPRAGQIDMALVLSRVSHPRLNELRLTIESPRKVKVELEVLAGRYDPLATYEVDRRWRHAATRTVPRGRHDIRLAIPWQLADLVAYPTSFGKVLEGRHTNVYHTTHVVRLTELHAATGEPIFAEFAARWREDICAWSEMELYDGLSVRSYWTPGEPVVDPERLCEPEA
jgi:hypothetical protein